MRYTPPRPTKIHSLTYRNLMHDATRGSLKELALFFLRLGVTAFGGPAAHIAIMEDELVRRRKWLSREKFLDLLGASNLIPGPSSSELAIHIGYLRAGWAGLLVGGACFILPAAILVGIIAWAYVRFGHLPAVAALLYGVKPVVIAVILQALWGLGRTAVKSWVLAIAGMICVALALAQVNVLLILFGTGAILAGIHALTRNRTRNQKAVRRADPYFRVARSARGAGANFSLGGRDRRGSGDSRNVAAFSRFPEDRFDCVRQRLCFAGISAGRSGRASRVGHGRPIGGCSRNRASDARAGVHHGYFPGLLVARTAWARWWPRLEFSFLHLFWWPSAGRSFR